VSLDQSRKGEGEELILAEKTAAQAEGEPCCDWVGQTG
jgi:6-phosphogluconate dehydrogenase